MAYPISAESSSTWKPPSAAAAHVGEAFLKPPLLRVEDAMLQYKTRLSQVTATYQIGFDVYPSDRFVRKNLIPTAFSSIPAGLKIGWAFAWRTLIPAELVFGVSAHSGGLGWHIYESRMDLDTPGVFAGLLTIILIGLFFEGVVFRSVEVRSTRLRGMQRE